MALEEKDKITLSSPLGPREIQVLIGDITRLPPKEKVDFVFTSSFCGDYQPVQNTLIGNLKENLNIDVHFLAQLKELDLTKNFSCWVSHQLEANLPFRRLVCFEYKRRANPLADQISNMFRAMMPIFNNTESSVITPLLATGCQAQSPAKVMEAMVNAAAQWIKAGLPLQCLKIVLYSDQPSSLTDKDKVCLKSFATLKNKWSEIENMTEEDSEPYDVCLSYTPKDEEWRDKVVESLRKHNSDIAIHSEAFVFNQEEIWQNQIYSVMKCSKRIIILLTPAYLSDSECLEQFNLALCCNRLKKEEVVIPFYLETIQSPPSYMSLVQYVECRARKDGEMASEILNSACASIVKSLETDNSQAENTIQLTDMEQLKRNREIVYDIFVSYSHSSGKEPRELVKILRKNYPDLNVFFDKTELKAGNLWQQALYEAVDKALCVVAFLSPGYIQSSVCNEEFNIALDRHYAHGSILLIPVHTDKLEMIPRSFSSVPCVDLGTEEESIVELAEKLSQMVARSKARFHKPEVKIFKQKFQDLRATDFKKKFRLDGGHVVRTTRANASDDGVVVFSFAQDCLKLAAIMSVIIKQHAPGLVCHLKASSQSERRTHLDTADMVVIFVSDEFVGSQHLVEELHTALCRQRTVKDSTVVYFIQCDHYEDSPFYLQALPFSVSLDDNIWRRLERASSNKNPRYLVDLDGMEGTYRCTSAQNLALSAAVHDIIFILSQRGTGSSIPYNVVNIARIENEVEGIGNEDVHVHEHIITLSQINHLMCKEPTPNPSPQPIRKPASLGNVSPRGDNKPTSDATNGNNPTTANNSQQRVKETVKMFMIPTQPEPDANQSESNKPSVGSEFSNPFAGTQIQHADSVHNLFTTYDSPTYERRNESSHKNLGQGESETGVREQKRFSKTCHII